MKNLAIAAIVLGLLNSAANAESAVNESNSLILASNSSPVANWLEHSSAANNTAINKQFERKVAKTMEKISIEIDKQLENKIAKELEYAMQ